MKVLIGNKHVGGRRTCFVGSCANCYDRTYVRRSWRPILESGIMLICAECAAVLFSGTVKASAKPEPGFQVYVDWHVLHAHEIGLAADLAQYGGHRRWAEYDPATGAMVDSDRLQSSPRWVPCPRCAAAHGDDCRGATYCPQRVEENRTRLENLDTWSVRWQTPCCKREVCLVWRTTEDRLEWSGVPCFECRESYRVEMYASELVDHRMPCERINPQRVQMCCWGSEEENPWLK